MHNSQIYAALRRLCTELPRQVSTCCVIVCSAIDEIRRDVKRKGGGELEYLHLDLACLRYSIILCACQSAEMQQRQGLMLCWQPLIPNKPINRSQVC